MINISDANYYEILVEVGYPVVKESDLEFTRQQLEDYFIFPAMREYFSWFPKIETQVAYVASTFSFDFPDEDTYGIIDARINTAITGDGKTSSPFVNSLFFKQNSSGSQMYGTKNDYGVSEARYLERSFKTASNNYIKAQRINVDPNLRKVTGYSTVNGEMTIKWAKYSNQFEDIPFKRKTEVINLAKSKILRGFAMLRGQFDSDTGSGFNNSDFMSRANDLEEKTIKKWEAMSKVAVIRN